MLPISTVRFGAIIVTGPITRGDDAKFQQAIDLVHRRRTEDRCGALAGLPDSAGADVGLVALTSRRETSEPARYVHEPAQSPHTVASPR
jgi:hypothetical protein